MSDSFRCGLSAYAAILVVGPVCAQDPVPIIGNCDRPPARATLDLSNVDAELFNAGIWRHETPKGSGLSGIQTMDIWVGGHVDGEFRVAGERRGGGECWPGPH